MPSTPNWIPPGASGPAILNREPAKPLVRLPLLCATLLLLEEGIRILPTRLYDGGKENRELTRMIRANVRVADQVMGDIAAQVTA